jgi:hypothetical protein
MREFMEFLKVPTTPHIKEEYAAFLKQFSDDLLLDKDRLSKAEKYLSKFVEKIVR